MRSSENARIAFRSCAIVDAACTPLPTTSPTTRPSRPSGERDRVEPVAADVELGRSREVAGGELRSPRCGAARPGARSAGASPRSSAPSRSCSPGRAPAPPVRRAPRRSGARQRELVRVRPGEHEQRVRAAPGDERHEQVRLCPATMCPRHPESPRAARPSSRRRRDAPPQRPRPGRARRRARSRRSPRRARPRRSRARRAVRRICDRRDDGERGAVGAHRGADLVDDDVATSARVRALASAAVMFWSRSERRRRTCSASKSRLRSSACAHWETTVWSQRFSSMLSSAACGTRGAARRGCRPASAAAAPPSRGRSTPRRRRSRPSRPASSAQIASPLAIARANGTAASSACAPQRAISSSE